ncbi:MAG: hypothetical protein B7Y40_08100 [Gammaproteobacteria bacterium 28-57-27]|nr:MAG: hypothetical protein B7Y40_08100 [Gammaproteobacteria bacterium 28-57-27]
MNPAPTPFPAEHAANRADGAEARMSALKIEIGALFAEIAALKAEMSAWYAGGQAQRFPRYPLLAEREVKLSRLDSEFKQLWDAHHAKQ